MKPRIFLTAEWRHLAVLNWEIDPDALEPHVPEGLALELWNGKAFVSLVGFQFRRAALYHVSIPFYRNFPEVNLRFYVTRSMPLGERRGVVFLSEIAPRRAVAYVARKFYGERYRALPMRCRIDMDGRLDGFARGARFEWHTRSDEFALAVASDAPPHVPLPGSLEEFIIEHYWAYSNGLSLPGGSMEYEVEHRPWIIRQATRAAFEGDAARLYGRHFAQALARPPASAFLANGSAVAVHQGTICGAACTMVGDKDRLAANARK